MNRSKLTHVNIIILLSLILSACGGGDGGDGGATSKPSNMVVSDSVSLFIAPSDSSYSTSRLRTSSRNTKNKEGDTNTIFTVSDEGIIREISWTNEDDEVVTQTDNPIYIENLDNGYMVVAFGAELAKVDSTYLVRKSDGAMYDTGVKLYLPIDGFENGKVIKTDASNNIYFLGHLSSFATDANNLVKFNISDSNTLTSSTINPDIDGVDVFDIDDGGNFIYYYHSSDDIASEKSSRIVKSGGGLQNIGNTGIFWKGLDGTFYSNSATGTPNGQEQFITKHSLTGSTYSSSEISYGSEFCYTIPQGGSYIIRTSTAVLVTNFQDNNICEVYNETMTPRIITSNMNSISSVGQSSNYYYFAGNDNTDNPVLRRFDSSDHTYVDVLDSGLYDVFKFGVSPDDKITFNALRMEDGIKVIGSISASEEVIILDSQANAEVSVLVRVN
jgi:hypothetical protein